jgi:hypothetical protein
METLQTAAEMEYDSKQPLEELTFVESGTLNLREVNPMITFKGSVVNPNLFRAYQLC